MTPAYEKVVEAPESSIRLDLYLAKHLVDRFSRTQVKRMVEDGDVLVNGRKVSAHYRVHPGDRVTADWPEPRASETRAEDIPLEILGEDESVLVVNKPAGIVVHPACGNPHHTLVNALLFHVQNLSSVGGPVRPGIVHRLDKETSGIMVIAKNDRAHSFLAHQFKNQTIERVYRVAVRGVVQHDEGVCEEPVGRAFLSRKKMIVKPSGGKDSVTLYRVLERFADTTLLDVRPKTGRTHQIRVHMAFLGHPVLGDALYGVPSPWIGRQAVHAFGLGFVHPESREQVYFEAPLPADFQNLLTHLK